MPVTLNPQQYGLIDALSPYDYGLLGGMSQEAYNLAQPKYYQPRPGIPLTLGPGYTPPAGGDGGAAGGLGGTLGGLLNDPSAINGLINRLFPPGDPPVDDAAIQQGAADQSSAIGAEVAAGIPGILEALNNPPPAEPTPSTDIVQTDPGAGPTYQEPIVGLLDPPQEQPPVGDTSIVQTDPGAGPTYQETAPVAGGALGGLLDVPPAGATGIGEGPNAEQLSQQAATDALPALGAVGAGLGIGGLAGGAAGSFITEGSGVLASQTGAIGGAAAGVEAGSSTAAATGASSAAAWAGPLAAIAMLYTYFRPAFDAHSVTLGEPKDGQRNVGLQSGQAALATGNLAYGGGNDASQGSGQWFLMQQDGTPYWIGDKNVDKIDNALIALSGGDPQANWDKKSYYGRTQLGPSPHSALESVYNDTGGQGAWGTDFYGWVGQIVSLKSNAPGSPHE